jgi:hypothetical protein
MIETTRKESEEVNNGRGEQEHKEIIKCGINEERKDGKRNNWQKK